MSLSHSQLVGRVEQSPLGQVRYGRTPSQRMPNTLHGIRLGKMNVYSWRSFIVHLNGVTVDHLRSTPLWSLKWKWHAIRSFDTTLFEIVIPFCCHTPPSKEGLWLTTFWKTKSNSSEYQWAYCRWAASRNWLDVESVVEADGLKSGNVAKWMEMPRVKIGAVQLGFRWGKMFRMLSLRRFKCCYRFCGSLERV